MRYLSYTQLELELELALKLKLEAPIAKLHLKTLCPGRSCRRKSPGLAPSPQLTWGNQLGPSSAFLEA